MAAIALHTPPSGSGTIIGAPPGPVMIPTGAAMISTWPMRPGGAFGCAVVLRLVENIGMLWAWGCCGAGC